MASEVDICNLALSNLGASVTLSSIKPPEGSAYAEYCALYYPIARNMLLEMHAWGFATIERRLAMKNKPELGYRFCYVVPDDCLKIIRLSCEQVYGQYLQYERRTLDNGEQVILTNSENVSAVYIKNITDTTRYSPLFITTLAWQLASMLAAVVVKGSEGMKVAQMCTQYVAAYLSQARVSDSMQHYVRPDYVPSSIKAR